MNKLLILTASTGQGHNQAASSLKEIFENKGYEVSIVDFLADSSKFLSTVFGSGYNFFASSFPKFYGYLYKISNSKTSSKILNLAFYSISKKLLKIINIYNPSAIITTHPLAVNILGSLKNKGLVAPTISIVTDFNAHYSYINQNIDAYITASEYTKSTLVRKGVNKDKIFPYGIPVNSDFKREIPDLLSTKDDDFFNILLMGGSMGLKQIYYVLKELLNNSHKLRITVVCGNNSNLKENLLTKYKQPTKDKKLHILGFTKDVSYLMDYSDLIITKPGGLTVTESITKNLPMIVPFCIPGQEVENIDFLTSQGYAIKVDNLLEINQTVDSLIDNPQKLMSMKNNLASLSKTYSSEKIYNEVNSLIKKSSYDENKIFSVK